MGLPKILVLTVACGPQVLIGLRAVDTYGAGRGEGGAARERHPRRHAAGERLVSTLMSRPQLP